MSSNDAELIILNAKEIAEKIINLFSNYIGLDPYRFRTVEAILSKDPWAKEHLEEFVKERDDKINKEVCSHLLFVKVVTDSEQYNENDGTCPNCRSAFELLRELFHAIKHHNRFEERQALTRINVMCPGAERHGNTDAITTLLRFAVEQDCQEKNPA